MTLDTENAKLFFKLFLPILDYVNLKCKRQIISVLTDNNFLSKMSKVKYNIVQNILILDFFEISILIFIQEL